MSNEEGDSNRCRLCESSSVKISIDTIVKDILPFVSDCRKTCNNVSVSCTEAQSAMSSMDLPWPQDTTLLTVYEGQNESLYGRRAMLGPPNAVGLASNMVIGRKGFIAAKCLWYDNDDQASKIVLWNCQTGQRRDFTAGSDDYERILFSPLHPHVLVFDGDERGTLEFWDVQCDPPIRRSKLITDHFSFSFDVSLYKL